MSTLTGKNSAKGTIETIFRTNGTKRNEVLPLIAPSRHPQTLAAFTTAPLRFAGRDPTNHLLPGGCTHSVPQGSITQKLHGMPITFQTVLYILRAEWPLGLHDVY